MQLDIPKEDKEEQTTNMVPGVSGNDIWEFGNGNGNG